MRTLLSLALAAGLGLVPAFASGAAPRFSAPASNSAAGINGKLLVTSIPRGIATLGPASWDINTIVDLAESGIFIFRVNYSHGSAESNAKIVERVRAASERIGRPLAVLGDLQGPKIRLGRIKGGSVQLRTGDPFRLTSDSSVIGNRKRASLDYPGFIDAARAGDTIIIGDGDVKLQVLSVQKGILETSVVEGGPLSDRKGLTLLNRDIPINTLMPKDRKDLVSMLEAGVDGIMLSMVRSAAPIAEAREIASRFNRADLPVWTKIENQAGLDKLAEIARAADVLVVAQGDLGVAMGRRLPGARAFILRAGRESNTDTAVATHLLRSSLKKTGPPTEDERGLIRESVAAGAVYFMLTDETAVGPRPVEAAASLSAMIEEAIAFDPNAPDSPNSAIAPRSSGLQRLNPNHHLARTEKSIPFPERRAESRDGESWIRKKTTRFSHVLLTHTEKSIQKVRELGKKRKENTDRPRRNGFMATVVGFGLIIGGIILVPLPTPGSPIIIAGLFMLATRFAWARKLLMAILVGLRSALGWFGRRLKRRNSEG